MAKSRFSNPQEASNILFWLAELSLDASVLGIVYFNTWSRMVKPSFSKFSPKSLTDIIQSLAKLSLFAHSEFDDTMLATWLFVAEKKFGEFDAENLSLSSFYLGEIMKNSHLEENLSLSVTSFVKQSGDCMAKMNAIQLWRMLSAILTVKTFANVEQLAIQWQHHMASHLATLSPNQLAQIMIEFAAVDLAPIEQSFVEKWAEISLKSEFEPKRLIFLLDTLEKLQIDHTMVKVPLGEHFLDILKQFPKLAAEFDLIVRSGLQNLGVSAKKINSVSILFRLNVKI
jgi:hypothetical protein